MPATADGQREETTGCKAEDARSVTERLLAAAAAEWALSGEGAAHRSWCSRAPSTESTTTMTAIASDDTSADAAFLLGWALCELLNREYPDQVRLSQCTEEWLRDPGHTIFVAVMIAHLFQPKPARSCPRCLVRSSVSSAPRTHHLSGSSNTTTGYTRSPETAKASAKVFASTSSCRCVARPLDLPSARQRRWGHCRRWR